MLGTTAGLTADGGAGAVMVPIACGWSDIAGRSTWATAGASACGCAVAGWLTTRVSMSAPLVPTDSTVGRDVASSAGTSSALLRLIRMRRLSDLEDSSAGAAWADPAFTPAAWSDAIPTLLRSPRPASASAALPVALSFGPSFSKTFCTTSSSSTLLCDATVIPIRFNSGMRSRFSIPSCLANAYTRMRN